jgi:hypothetical protein
MHTRSLILAIGLVLSACGGKTSDDNTLTPDSAITSDTSTSADTAPGTTDAAPPDMTACTGPGTCSLVAKTCCGSCSPPTTENMTAISKGRETEYRNLVCGPDPVGCPDCAPLIPDGSIQAWCVANRCKPIDVKKEPVSNCNTDADCVLRHAPCCEPCDENPYDLVALNPSQVMAYRAMVCVGDEACPRCAARYPADTSAVCDPATKHCRVKSPMSP